MTCVVPAGGAGDFHAEAFAESAGNLAEHGKSVLADEQVHTGATGAQCLQVRQVQLVRPELDPEQGAGGRAQALAQRAREKVPAVDSLM